eukprot:COSAG03_NODE_8689_length_779_cov_1.580882_1_plen_124_part_00
MSVVTDSAEHLKAAIQGTPVQPLAKQLADAAGQQDEGLVMVGVIALGLLVGLFLIGAVNIVTGVGFVVPAYSSLQIMQRPSAEKDIMTKMVPVRRVCVRARAQSQMLRLAACVRRSTGSCLRV